jgi:hypothetical protein
LIDDRVLDIAIQEVKGVHLVSLNGEPIAAELEFDPAGQIILVLGFLRTVLEVAIVNCFGPANIIDSHDHRVHRRKRFLASVHESRESEANDAQYQNSDLQIGIHHKRLAILFEILFRRSCEIGLSHFDLHSG